MTAAVSTEEIIMDLCDLYQPETFDEAALASYLQALEVYTPGEIRQAAQQWQRQSQWMPRPSELIALIRQDRDRQYNRRRNQEIIAQARGRKCQAGFRLPPGMKPMDYIVLLQSEGLDPDQIARELCG